MQNQAPAPQPTPAAKPKAQPTPPIPPEFQAARIMAMDAPQLVPILKDASASMFDKSKACMRLAMVGTKDAVPALAALLTDEKLSHYARFGLVPIPDPSVDDALRAALKTTKGTLLVGVIDSIGQRRDAKAVQPLTTMMYGSNPDVARAAAAAIGSIGGAQGMTVLQAALLKTKGPVRTAVAEAGLVCAERLLEQNDRKSALALYSALSRPEIPRPVRLAAMHSTIAVETAINRPKAPPSASAPPR
jgi:HEAT repeat protein